MYEYKIIAIDWAKWKREREGYEKYINEFAKEGWRLVQIITPGVGFDGTVNHYEIIMERDIY